MSARSLACGAALALAAALAPAGAAARDAAPAYDLALLDGGRVASADLAGKVVVVNFWATWCAPCLAELPAFDRYARAHRDAGLEVIAVSLDAPDALGKVRRLVKDYAFTTAIAEGSRIDGFGKVLPLPSTFVLDRRGVVRKARWRKEPFIDEKALEAVVTPLLQRRPDSSPGVPAS
jgi:cytochrome c biogenesis protein CcmG, thiol:disulfide interchange protein DsbE